MRTRRGYVVSNCKSLFGMPLMVMPLLVSGCGESPSDQGTVRVTSGAAPTANIAPVPAPSPSPSPEASPTPRFTPCPDIVAAIKRGGDLPPLPPPDALPKPENRMPTQADIVRLQAEFAKKKQGGE